MSLIAGRVAGSLVALAVLGAGTVGVVATFLEHRLALTSTLVAGQLVVTDDIGDVTVHTGAPGQPIRVVRTFHWTLHRPPDAAVPLTDPGDPNAVATIDSQCGGFRLDNCAVDLDITMPPVTGLQISVTTGDVRVDGAAGPLTVRTVTGDITATGLRAAEPDLETGTGDLVAHFAAAPTQVQLRTTVGDVTVGLPGAAPYLVRARATVGDTNVTVPTSSTSHRTVDVTTQTGDVSVVTEPVRAP